MNQIVLSNSFTFIAYLDLDSPGGLIVIGANRHAPAFVRQRLTGVLQQVEHDLFHSNAIGPDPWKVCLQSQSEPFGCPFDEVPGELHHRSDNLIDIGRFCMIFSPTSGITLELRDDMSNPGRAVPNLRHG